MYQVTFTTPIIPEGGEIRFLYDSNSFTSYNNGSCRVGTNYLKSSTETSVLRCYRGNGGFRISGFTTMANDTSVTAFIFLKSIAGVTNSAVQVDIYGLYNNNSTRIALVNAGTVTFTTGTMPSQLFRYEEMIIPYFSSDHSNNYYILEGTFNLRTSSILNGDYLYFTEPAGFNIYGNRRMIIRQNSSTVTGWTEMEGYNTGTNTIYRYQIPSNVDMTLTFTTNTVFIFRLSSVFTDPYLNGVVTPPVGDYRWWFSASHSGATTDVAYFDFSPTPQPATITITNRYQAAGRQTVMDIMFTINVNISVGCKIVVSFDSSNLLNQMFAVDLEGTGPATGETYRYLDCS
ncbi:unnamed protein product [Sphagnum balticum]